MARPAAGTIAGAEPPGARPAAAEPGELDGGAARLAAPERFDVLGVGIDALDLEAAVARIEGWIESRRRGYVCFANVYGVVESRRDPALRRSYDGAGLVGADGMPLVWIGRARGHRRLGRVYGPDLMLRLIERGLGRGARHFFYGGAPGVPERLAERLSRRFPGLRVAGTCSPPFRPPGATEEAAAVAAIEASEADVVWVGLGTPKQERWMAAHRPRLSAPVLLGVGAAFDFHAGRKPQAPRWLRGAGLEWLFRLLTEPRRLAPRYLSTNPLFLYLLLREARDRRRLPPPGGGGRAGGGRG